MTAGRRPTLAAWLETLLARQWWQPRVSLLALCLWPLSLLYGGLAALRRVIAVRPQALPVPLLVVGNLIAGGAGKTPTVIALVAAFRAAGRRPGVISRGQGRHDGAVREVSPADEAQAVGDEPLLIRRRTSEPVWVGRDRAEAARALCARHPHVDVLIADDGLQHAGLAPDAALIVFDDRGIGNGLLLPAGPLRQTLPARLSSRTRVLYTGSRASTTLPGTIAQGKISVAWPLAAWQQGDAASSVVLGALRDRPLLAVAGLAAPEKFFTALEEAGLSIERLALPDHYAYRTLPWAADRTDVITTEKDAVKLDPRRLGLTRVWVVPLDLQLPAGLADELLTLLRPASTAAKP